MESHESKIRPALTGVKLFRRDFFWTVWRLIAYIVLGMALDNRDRIRKALQDAQWVVAYAARELGVSRQAVYDAMKRHGIARRKPNPAVWRQLKRELGSRGGRPRRVAA